jgi:catechol 2,3-dioxygenase-like lactoylglutathione lyase family enzyme
MRTIAVAVLAVCLSMAATSTTTQNKEEKKMQLQDVTPNLIVSNIDRSAAFYRDVLGFEQVRTVPDQPPFVFVWLKQGNVNLYLNVPQPAKPGAPDMSKAVAGTNSLYIHMTGLQSLADRVEKHGVKFAIPLHKEFYGMNEFAVLDPDGYLLIFAEPAQ